MAVTMLFPMVCTELMPGKPTNITKNGRRNPEKIMRDMFRMETLTGDENPVTVWGMHQGFMDAYSKGTLAYRYVNKTV